MLGGRGTGITTMVEEKNQASLAATRHVVARQRIARHVTREKNLGLASSSMRAARYAFAAD